MRKVKHGRLLRSLSDAGIKYPAQKQLGVGRSSSQFTDDSLSSRDVRTELKQKPDTEAMEGHCLLAHLSASVSYTAQDDLDRK